MWEPEADFGAEPTGIADFFIEQQRRVIASIESSNVHFYIQAHKLRELLARTILSQPDFFPYHDLDHSLIVCKDARRFVRAVKLIDSSVGRPSSERIADIGGQGHDVVLSARLVATDDFDGMLRLQQNSGVSENESARMIRAYMLSLNDAGETPLLTETDIQEGMDCAIATIPSFEGQRVFQAHLGPKTSLPALAVAFADLGIAMDGPKAFLNSSNAFLREHLIGIKLLLMRASESTRLTPDERAHIARAIRIFSEGQPVYLEERIKQLPSDLISLPEKVRSGILPELLGSHEKARDYMRKVAKRRTGMSTRDLLIDCGYSYDLYSALDRSSFAEGFEPET